MKKDLNLSYPKHNKKTFEESFCEIHLEGREGLGHVPRPRESGNMNIVHM